MVACEKHRFCQNTPKGVAVCIVDPQKRTVLLGLEMFGKYRGKFNICAGSLEPEDQGCAIKAAKRELREEFKLDIADSDFQKAFCFRRPDVFRFVMVGPTPVFVGYFDADALSARDLTVQMKADIDDQALPGTHKEMEQANWFSLDENASIVWSRFARIAVKRVVSRPCRSTQIVKAY